MVLGTNLYPVDICLISVHNFCVEIITNVCEKYSCRDHHTDVLEVKSQSLYCIPSLVQFVQGFRVNFVLYPFISAVCAGI